MNMLVWNVRGLTDESKRLMKEYCHSFAPIVLGIIEPKSKFQKVQQNFWLSLNMVPCHQNCRLPRRSNIWFLTHPSVQTSVVLSSSQAVVVDCYWQNRNFRVAVVHGSNDAGERRFLWADLISVITRNTVFIGDFNAVKGANERISSVSPSRHACQDFCDFIENSGFGEPTTSGLHFTWSGRRFLPRHVESVLDRALISDGFADMWDSINSHALPRISSDHSPLVLQCKLAMPTGKRHFKFLNMWVLHPEFQNMVAASWNDHVDAHCPIFRVMFKLRRLRGVIRSWNKTVFGNVDTAILDNQQDLLDIQAHIAESGYTDDLFDEEVSAQAKINVLLSRKNSMLQQKSRLNWLVDGDRNTTFFHNMIKFRNRGFSIGHLKIDGVVVHDPAVIEAHVTDFFSSLFTEDRQTTVDLAELEANIDPWVSELQNNHLTSIPLEDEISASVFSMDANSSPGPDGFSGCFFQSCWSTIKVDIIAAVRAFFLNSYLPAGCNASTLILIPKKDAVETVADLRPIILSNFFFKIISKILATRLSLVAAEGVSQNQFGFIKGRSIHDCIVLGSEGFNCMNRSGRGSNIACKVDIRKAFDTMSWEFILQVLRANNFHENFISWISIIFTSARISILYNGNLSGYFACSRGVRQGDPLSPILFGIAEDVLSHLFINCVNSHHLQPMSFSRVRNFPTHLLYADDILIFCKASQKNARKIKEILDYYGRLSGQVCSVEKSHVFFGSGVAAVMRRNITRELGFAVGCLPVTYLGVPIFTGRSRASYFTGIFDRIVQKFSRWKGLHLSIAGRLCLIRSVIQSSVIHSMMVYRWPKSLLHSLDKKCRNFLWTGRIDQRPSCPVGWSRVCAIRQEGGLGLRAFGLMNKSFMMKLAWKCIKGTDFAYSILRTRYLTSFGHAKSSLLSSPIWTSIRENVSELVENSYSFIGDGSSTYFWLDDWLGYKLVDKLQVPYFMHEFLHQSVADYYFEGVWHFSEDFFVQFPDTVCDILLLPIGESEDLRFWKHSVRGDVTAALAYSHACHSFPKVHWGDWIWENYIPVRRSIVCWRIIQNRLPTLDVLIRQGILGPNRCSICGAAEETISHLFWECSVVRPIWRDFLGWFHQDDFGHCPDIHSFLVSAWNAKFSSQVNSFWKLGVLSLLWRIWEGRNRVVFNDDSFDPRAVMSFVKVAFKELDASSFKIGSVSNSWQDYLITRSIGVVSRASPPPLMIEVYWWPPAGQWIKVNTDGSASGAPGDIAAGGVFRDKFGWVRGCFHMKCGRGYAFEAELYAVIAAIAIAYARGWMFLWIEADSMYVVNLLSSRARDVPWRFVASWNRTLHILTNMQMMVSHIYREGNTAADIMANPDRSEGWWPHAIDDVKKAVALDMATHSFVRVRG
ncbi:uncharacterized protein LOC131018226 [Salvia miltiorrhiza]|uniref:uncharacterized protein LOC131018226 n=1 Tax=Salvia miltiorrhiza TaxID=226208 RepID=UPI0025AB5EB4|nr:uncharacterized protein LOC131018226 [Salvia miltiorrhiza]